MKDGWWRRTTNRGNCGETDSDDDDEDDNGDDDDDDEDGDEHGESDDHGDNDDGDDNDNVVRMRMRMIDGAQFLPGVQFPNAKRRYVQYSSCVFLPGNMEWIWDTNCRLLPRN